MGVTRTVKRPGTGATPKAGNTVTVHCTGFLPSANKKKF